MSLLNLLSHRVTRTRKVFMGGERSGFEMQRELKHPLI